MRLFEQCAKLADGGEVIVGVNTDEFAATFKPAPVQDLAERLEMVVGCMNVNTTFINDEADLTYTLLNHQPNILAVGDDWLHKDYFAQIGVTQEWLDEHGIKLVYITRDYHSSTELKARIRA